MDFVITASIITYGSPEAKFIEMLYMNTGR
jgi:hypothetical protein